MSKVSKPYQAASGWCFRRRVRGQDFYVSSKCSAQAAHIEMAHRMCESLGHYQSEAPQTARSTLGQALLEFRKETFPCLEGARQDRRRRRPACCNTAALSQTQVHALIARALEVSNA